MTAVISVKGDLSRHWVQCPNTCNWICQVAALLHTYMSLVVRKPVFGFFDLVPHKPGCTGTEDG